MILSEPSHQILSCSGDSRVGRVGRAVTTWVLVSKTPPTGGSELGGCGSLRLLHWSGNCSVLWGYVDLRDPSQKEGGGSGRGGLEVSEPSRSHL